jgi:hypothetical protein
MLSQTQKGYEVLKYGDNFVTFSNGIESNSFILIDDLLYFNKIKLCEDVEEFKVEKTTAENGKDVLKTYIKLNGIVYTTDYVLE